MISGIDTSKIYANKVNYNAGIFKNVFKKKEQNLDLPYVLKRVIFNDQSFSNEEIILNSEKNDKLISSSIYGKGIIYTFSQAADDSYGNLVYHPIWVPMIYNMIFTDFNLHKIYHTLGEDDATTIKNETDAKDNVIHIQNFEGTKDIIPQISSIEGSMTKIFLNNTFKIAGHYKVVSSGKTLKGISFNYNRKESDLKHFSSEQLNTFIENNNLSNISVTDFKSEFLSEVIQKKHLGKQLWKFFLIFTLVFLLIEIVLVRFIFDK